MVSTWTEYLVLRKFEGSPTRIEVCMYEGLGLACDYYDEELEEFILPDLIDNMKVIGIDDEAVVGGELVAIDSVDPLEIDGLDTADIIAWATSLNFILESADLERHLREPK